MTVLQESLNQFILSRNLDHREQVLKAKVLDAAERARKWLLKQQAPEGYWMGELEGDTILESEYIILLTFLGLDKHQEKIRTLARYIIQKQQDDGGWGTYPGAPPDLSASVKAYLALRLAGCSVDEPRLVKAKALIRSLGGVDAANSFTKIYLAMLGQYPWEKCPAVLPEVILFPHWSYFSVYAMSAWSRTIVVPLSIIWAFKPVVRIPVTIDELFVPAGKKEKDQTPLFSWRSFFLKVDKVLKFLEKLPVKPFRAVSLRKAEAWILERFRKSDGLGAIFPPMVDAVIALKCLGYRDDDSVFRDAIAQLEKLEILEDGVLRMQPCLSPIWDTALAITALEESGLSKTDSALLKSAQWLLSKQVKEPGDWKIHNPSLPAGGWVFQFNNEFYPDVDDTAIALLSLARVDFPYKRRAVSLGLRWILGMQGSGGGWAAFDRDNNHEILTQVPFADHNAMLDPACPDLTGRVLEMLSAYGYTMESVPVKRAIEYLISSQEPEGCWYGRWGVNYVYGTWQVLKGLSCIGEQMDAVYVQKAVQWLKEVQNLDGGWGESCRSYEDPSYKGKGESTPSQTAWALMGLIAAGEQESPAVTRGFQWLLVHQLPEGTWNEELFTGTGFPKVFYLRYHLYRHYFPLFALGMYLQKFKEVF